MTTPRRRAIRYERERDYPMSLAEAWRLLADTDHLNRNVGLPAVSFSAPQAGDGGFVRTARARAYGVVPVRWKEYPFDWVRERRYAVRREFEGGPLESVEGGVELEPLAEGVRVKVFADITPANPVGRLVRRAAVLRAARSEHAQHEQLGAVTLGHLGRPLDRPARGLGAVGRDQDPSHRGATAFSAGHT